MRPFKYYKAADAQTASRMLMKNSKSQFLAGGTNLLDLMKEDVERPPELVDISRINVDTILETSTSISVSAFEKNTVTANHSLIRRYFPMLSQAILAGASAQIRNMASNGGNLNQRTRCPYFYEISMPCNKREPGSGCSALEGVNRMHAIFGWSKDCIAVHPSDMCVALAALDAKVNILGISGEQKSVPFTEYHRLPGKMPEKDNVLLHGEIITGIEIPKNNFKNNSCYIKIRERSSYAFALISVAAAMELEGNTIKDVRIALGGVAHKPWRALAAEKFLTGKTANLTHFKAAAEAELKMANAFEYNKYKIEMSKKAIVRALSKAFSGETG